MKYSKTLFLLGIILIVLPFTGLSLAVKNWVVVALGVWVLVIALLEQITSAVGERESSYKKVSVESSESEGAGDNKSED